MQVLFVYKTGSNTLFYKKITFIQKHIYKFWKILNAKVFVDKNRKASKRIYILRGKIYCGKRNFAVYL